MCHCPMSMSNDQRVFGHNSFSVDASNQFEVWLAHGLVIAIRSLYQTKQRLKHVKSIILTRHVAEIRSLRQP